MKKTGTIALIISIVSLALSLFCMTSMTTGKDNSAAEEPAAETITQYVMYVGTNDKDTYKPEHTNEEAFDIVDQICLKHFEGYTLQEATGSWTDDTNTPTHEYTLVCYFDDVDESIVYEAADEIIEALNQNTVLIEKTELQIDYYGGAA